MFDAEWFGNGILLCENKHFVIAVVSFAVILFGLSLMAELL